MRPPSLNVLLLLVLLPLATLGQRTVGGSHGGSGRGRNNNSNGGSSSYGASMTDVCDAMTSCSLCAHLKSDPGCNLATVTEVKQYSSTIVAPIAGDVSTWSTALVLAVSALAEALRALANQINSFSKTEIVATASATEGVACPSSNPSFPAPVCTLLDTGAFSLKAKCPSGLASQVYCQATQNLGEAQKARAVALVASGTSGGDFYCSADATRGLEAGPVTLYMTATCAMTAQPAQQAMEASTSAAITIRALLEALAQLTGGGKAVMEAILKLVSALSALPVSVPVQPTVNTLITVLLDVHAGNATAAFNATDFGVQPCGCAGWGNTSCAASTSCNSSSSEVMPPTPYNVPDDGDDDGGGDGGGGDGDDDPCAGGGAMSGARCHGGGGKKKKIKKGGGGGKSGKHDGARLAVGDGALYEPLLVTAPEEEAFETTTVA